MKTDMTKGNPMKIILLFSIPVLMGNLFQQFYNMVDTIIVGQYLGSKALAAVGSTGCIMFLVLGFANGIAQGFGVMASHAFGAKKEKLLKHYVALAIILTVIVSVVLTIPTVLASRQLLIWLNTPDDILVMADAYIKVIFAGIFCTMSYNVASGLLRSIGDSKTPLYFLIFFICIEYCAGHILYRGGEGRHSRSCLCDSYIAGNCCSFVIYRDV